MDPTGTEELDPLVLREVATRHGGVVVRRARPGDLAAVARMHRRCSSDTVFRRYFSAVPALSPTLQARLLETRLALVAGIDREIVGMGHLCDHPGGPVELALVVEDAWQRVGLGRALAEAALDVAESWGLDRVVTYSLASSYGAQGLMRSVREGGLRARFHQGEDGVVRTVLSLPSRPAPGALSA